eukprot:2609556-Rhodomonas_salina.1
MPPEKQQHTAWLLAFHTPTLLSGVQLLAWSYYSTTMGVNEEDQPHVQDGTRSAPVGMLHGGKVSKRASAGPNRLHPRRQRIGG